MHVLYCNKFYTYMYTKIKFADKRDSSLREYILFASLEKKCFCEQI